MKKLGFLYFFCILNFVYPLWSQNADSALRVYQNAEAERQSGNLTAARSLYEQAANMGNADAHFALTYYFIVEPAYAKSHLKTAALLGHQQALNRLIEYMFSRAGNNDDVTPANPVELLNTINEARRRFPNLKVDPDMYRAINRAAEAGDLDLQTFFNRYNISISDMKGDMYFLWVLAEDASKTGGIIPGPDMKLTLQLIARGGNVPAEIESAVEFAYNCWKSGINKDFDIADHVTSGMGMNYITARKKESINSVLSDQLGYIVNRTPNNARQSLINAYKAAEAFFESKVWNEEGHDGSGYYTWAQESLNQQKRQYLETIDGLVQRKINIPSKTDNESILNTTYRQLIDFVKKNNISGMHFSITEEGIRSTQRLWLPYRDRLIEFLQLVRPDISKDSIRIWLNEKRIEDFKAVMEMD